MKAILTFTCLCVAFANGLQLGQTKLKVPSDLSRVMADVTSLEEFLRAMSVDPDVISSLRDFSDSEGSGGAQAHVNLGKFVPELDYSDLPQVLLDSAPCKGRPEPVEVPQPREPNSLNFPLFVNLHRCRGACTDRPFETSCEAAETQDLALFASKVTWPSSSSSLSELRQKVTLLRVTNHTKCGCQCTVKPEECDKRTQIYSKENCRCECKPGIQSCPIRYVWHPEKCQCVCEPSAIQRICKKRFQFDHGSCKCVCSKRPCKNRNKVRDPSDCHCKCPRFNCPRGMVYDPQTCDCIE